MTYSPIKKTSNLPEHYIAAELNLSRLPFFASSTKSLKSKDGITYQDRVTYEGKEVEFVWEVTGNSKYGYPGPFAESVHVALLDIVTEQGLPFENPVVFSFYDICKRLDIEYNGKNTRSIRNAILSIRLAGIVIENSFVTKDGRRLSYTPDPTFLYKRVALYGDTDPRTGESRELSAVWLSDFYLDSLNSGNIRPIDFQYFKYLHKQSFAATKLYEYLGYRFSGTFKHKNDYAKVDYDKLTTIIDLTRQEYLSQAKQKLERAHQALIDTSLVSRIEWFQEKQRHSPAKFYLHYYPGKRARREYRRGRLSLAKQLEFSLLTGEEQKSRDKLEKEKATELTSLAHELETLGVTSERATELVQAYSKERVTRQLDHLEYLSETGKSLSDPSAWLVSAIREDYATPQGFKNREDRKAEEKARAKATARREEELQKEKRREEARKAHQRELDQQLSELPKGQRQKIEGEIIRRIEKSNQELMRTIYQTKTLDPRSPMHRAEYYAHLAKLLKTQHTPD